MRNTQIPAWWPSPVFQPEKPRRKLRSIDIRHNDPRLAEIYRAERHARKVLNAWRRGEPLSASGHETLRVVLGAARVARQ